jgi:hypothetical protein
MSAPTSPSTPRPLFAKIKPFLTPYYIAVASVLGLITVGFGALVVVLLLIETNFNVLALIE